MNVGWWRGAALGASLLLAACVVEEPSGPDLDAASSTESVASTTSSPSSIQPTTSSSSTSTAPPTTALTTTTTVPVATTIVPPPGPLFGIAVPEDRLVLIETTEEEVGQTFHIIRVFRRWEDPLGASDVAAIQAGGRAIHLSVRPVRPDGAVIPWADVASAEEGSALHAEMVQWADDVIALGPDTRFTFNHEPETRESVANGDALAYRGAWRRMVELIRERGGSDIDMVWTVGAEALDDETGRNYYPGDDVVDVIGGDLYNWFRCQGTNRPWASFDDLIEPAVEFAAERGKPLALPEFASAADPADLTRRAGWMDAAVDAMLAWDPAERSDVELDFVIWFDVTAPGGTNPNCRWAHRTDPETQQAFARMARDLIGA